MTGRAIDQQRRPASVTAGSTLKIYEGAYHDLLNDSDKEMVIADIEEGINARLPKA